jgi:hypothetical protein
MTKPLDLIGQRFGRWTILRRSKNSRWGRTQWLCRCDCGRTKIIVGNSLKNRVTNSCGCLRVDLIKETFTTHGQAGKGRQTKTYRCWKGMFSLHQWPSKWKDYGGRGITICRRWHKFENFFVDMGESPHGMSLDRKDNDKGNTTNGIRWTTPSQQRQNQRRSQREI